MKTAVLRGRDHTGIGDVAAVAEGRLAIAISRGGAIKRYRHKDPNEDVVAVAEADGGVLLLVADGHGGCEAAEEAVEHLLRENAPSWTAGEAGDLREGWEEIARGAIFRASQAALGRATRAGAPESRTTLVVCLAREREGFVAWASVGDSHLFHVGPQGEAVDLAEREEEGLVFLGQPADTEESLAGKCATGIEALDEVRALVLVTDGLSEQGIGVDVPDATVAECAERARRAPGRPDLRPLGTARGVVEAALEAQRRQRAGDNVASAVLWLDAE